MTSTHILLEELVKLFEESEKHETTKLHPFKEDEVWSLEKYNSWMMEQYLLAENGDLNSKKIVEKTIEAMRLARLIWNVCPVCNK